MIKLFGGGKPDHPMGDPKEAKRIFEALPATDSAKALEELTHWMGSVATAEGFKLEDRIQRLFAVDEVAQPRVRKLTREYLAAVRPSKFQETRLWTLIHEYWKQAGQSYARCVDPFVQNAKGADAAKSLLPTLLARTLSSLAQQLKWMHLRYGPIDVAVWGVINTVYGFAEKRKLAQTKVAGYPGIKAETTPIEEFLRVVVFSASSPDSLLPPEAELAERLIVECAGKFALAAAATPDHVYWTDLAQPMAPQRLVRMPPPAPGQRFVDAAAALAHLEPLLREVQTAGKVPPGVNLGTAYEAETLLEVMRHLALCWSPAPPERKHPRHNVKSRLSVVHGLEAVLEALDADAGTSLNFDGSADESWIVENVSAGGFGAVVPQLKGDWLRVGVLLAMQPEGGNNWVVGVVRRVQKPTAQQARVGIETLSKAPMAMQFAVSGAYGATQRGVQLRTGDAGTGEAQIVMPTGGFVPGQNLESERAGMQHVYLPQGVAERGEDYEIARYREMIREA